MIDKHPNATVAGGTGLASVILVFALERAGLDLPPEVAAAIPVAAIAAVLFAGRRGLRGLVRLAWRGDPDL